MPTTPITLDVLGVDKDGTPREGATPSVEDLNQPGFSDTWTDVETLKASSNGSGNSRGR
jgi:peptide/nickel transport system ATP-binding protein/oligopeptide transport system ATP-binding protein